VELNRVNYEFSGFLVTGTNHESIKQRQTRDEETWTVTVPLSLQAGKHNKEYTNASDQESAGVNSQIYASSTVRESSVENQGAIAEANGYVDARTSVYV